MAYSQKLTPVFEGSPNHLRCPRSGAKFHKPDVVGRPGRLHRALKKYELNKTHVGKGTTLRSHRSEK